MNISKAIQCGDLEALRANEHEIIQDVNDMMKNSSIAWEDYITYWMVMHQDREIATQMFEVFLNTCSTAFSPDKYEEIMYLYSYPTMVGAIANENIDIIKYLSKYQTRDTFVEEIRAQYGDKQVWPKSLLMWYRRTFS